MQVNQEKSTEKIPQEILSQAEELARGAEVLPGGVSALAEKIYACKKAGKPLRAKFGIDPTSSDLHLGHAVVFRRLRKFQEFGHQVVLIIGGFTAQIGDPSGRNSTRPPLTAEEVQANAKTYLDQVGVVLDLEKTELTNNADWLTKLNLSEVLKLAGTVTANQLLAKEGFGGRLDKQLPVGFHELFYPLLQGYDSVAIRADIEFGGTDQRFNILQGRELQPFYGQEPQLVFLLPLLEGTDGVQKMSKSYNNYIGLKEPPSDMFGKCMRIPDELIIKYFELATTLSNQEIDEIKARLQAGGNPKIEKEKLGKQIVEQYHGEDAAKIAANEWDLVHSQGVLPNEMAPYEPSSPKEPLFRALVGSGLASSGAEAKRLVLEGAVKIDGATNKDPNHEITKSDDGKVLQVGRRKFVKLVLKN